MVEVIIVARILGITGKPAIVTPPLPVAAATAMAPTVVVAITIIITATTAVAIIIITMATTEGAIMAATEAVATEVIITAAEAIMDTEVHRLIRRQVQPQRQARHQLPTTGV